MKRNASVTWSGTPREGQGVFRVGSGALDEPFTYNSRFVGNSQTNPEELLLAALAGCLTMAMAGALLEQNRGGGQIDTSAELDIVAREEGGYRIPTIRLEMTVHDDDVTQAELDRAVGRAEDTCPICNALAGTDVRVTAMAAPTVIQPAPD